MISICTEATKTVTITIKVTISKILESYFWRLSMLLLIQEFGRNFSVTLELLSKFMFFTFFRAFVDLRIRSNVYRVNMRYVSSLPLDRF